MTWNQIDELYISIVTTPLNGVIPMGTRHHFKLTSGVEAEQRVNKVRHLGKIEFSSSSFVRETTAWRFSFGNRFFDAEKIVGLLNEFTFPVLWRKAVEKYNAAANVRFGCVCVNKDGIKMGLSLFPDLMKHPIPWSQVCSTTVEKGRFLVNYVDKSGTIAVASATLADVANLQVMLALIERIKTEQVKSATV